jgi:2-succinyl-5-enolpyruvyl-6-hydroxy-3-cyclohexene-1-carboxylate synthase
VSVDATPKSASVAATFCATLVDEWVRGGVRHAVVSPGSRSTPLALALAAEPRLRLSVHHDERSAGFVALGIGLATGVPAVVLTTSGTAAVELHPAVVEAHHAGVPLIACTADRPPWLRGVGAPQTIDQRHLYGSAVRAFVDPGVPDAAGAGGWRALAAGVLAAACGSPPGPVQVNLAFDEPLVGVPGALPPPLDPTPTPPRRPHPDAAALARLAAVLGGRRGVLVAGGGIDDPEGVALLADALGWPVLADPRSGCRIPARHVVAHFDALVRSPAVAEELVPEVVVRLGGAPASKVLATWLDGLGNRQVGVHADGMRIDPGRALSEVVAGEPGAVCRGLIPLVSTAPPGWLDAWARAEGAAAAALADVLDGPGPLSEPAVARTVAASVPDDGTLVVSSSMPVRDLEWYAAPRRALRVLANRGANGIDGVVSTALGVALAAAHGGPGGPVVALVGDVALLHDATSLVGLAARGVDLTVVVVDNDGGGIFSFLPQATALEPATFETLFGTPHGADIAALAAACGVPTSTVGDAAALGQAVGRGAGAGVRVVVVRTERAGNVGVHDALHDATGAAVRAAVG